jgi:hypothetical protein
MSASVVQSEVTRHYPAPAPQGEAGTTLTYLEARWASLVPYGAAADLLADILLVASGTNATTLRKHTLRVAERAEAELGDERASFIEGCPADWQKLSILAEHGRLARDWRMALASDVLVESDHSLKGNQQM